MSDSRLRTSVAADLGSLAEGFAPRAQAPELESGMVVGEHFVIEETLGRGGMGVVYRAHDRELDRRVAIKIGIGGGDLARARREAIALARLAHPNVITIYEIGEHEGVPFVAMEMCERGTVRAWMAEAPRTWREILDVYLAAGRGLAAAHAAGLVHRDVKPDNILLGVDGRARIADFGLVRSADRIAAETDASAGAVPATSDLDLTAVGSLVGTPRYMAPEQLVGGAVDARTDQFAFCVALYEALAGVGPFPPAPAERDAAMAAARFTAPRRDRTVPRKLLASVERGLAPVPADRFATMDELLAALQRAARSRRRITLAVAAVLALVGGIAFTVFAMTRPPVERVIEKEAAPPTCATLPGNLTPGWTPAARDAFISGNLTAGESAHWAAEVIEHNVRVLSAARAACRDLMPRASRSASVARLEGAACLSGAAARIAEVVALRDQDPAQLTSAAGRVVESAACAVSLSGTAALPDRAGPIWELIADAERLAIAGDFEGARKRADEALRAAYAETGEVIITRAEFTHSTILEREATRKGRPPRLHVEVALPVTRRANLTTIAAPGAVAPDAVPEIVSVASRLNVFVRAPDGVLLTAERSADTRDAPGVWTQLAPVVAKGASSPAMLVGDASAIASDGRLEVFFRMPLAGNLLHAVRDERGWRVNDLGGLVGRVGDTVRVSPSTRLTFTSPDPTLYPWFDHRVWFVASEGIGAPRPRWSYHSEHVTTSARPSAVTRGRDGRIDTVALDNRGHLSWFTGAGMDYAAGAWIWRPEEMPLDVMLEDPLLVVTGDALVVVVRASDGTLWIARKAVDEEGFGSLTPLGARSEVMPAVVARGPDRLAVVGREAGALVVLDIHAAAGDKVTVSPIRVAASLAGAVSAVAMANGVHVLGFSSAGALQHLRVEDAP